MKRNSPLMMAIFAVFFLLSTSCTSVKSYSKPGTTLRGARIGVLPFDCSLPDIGNTVSDTLGANLLGSECTIIERTYLLRILEENGLSMTEIGGNPDYKEIGKISNVEYLLVGSVTADIRRKALFISAATAKIVDVATGEVVVTATAAARGRGSEYINPVMMGEALAKGIMKEIAK
jgi:curli biogenesis system outer membrane secretion channel CsgG